MCQAARLGVSSPSSQEFVPLPGWRQGLLHRGILLLCFEYKQLGSTVKAALHHYWAAALLEAQLLEVM